MLAREVKIIKLKKRQRKFGKGFQFGFNMLQDSKIDSSELKALKSGSFLFLLGTILGVVCSVVTLKIIVIGINHIIKFIGGIK